MNILITGGSSGLGNAMVKTFLEQGNHQLYFTYRNSKQQAEEMVAGNPNCQAIKCDFNEQSDIDALIEQLKTWDLDVLINNAYGRINKTHFHKKRMEEFASSFQTNILPLIAITQAAVLTFKKKKSGKIINILSSAIINTPPVGWSTYVAEKNYVLGLSKAWATEYAKFNISSNCISPSMMRTPLTADVDERILGGIIAAHPRKELLTVTEVAKCVADLSNATNHINGINMVINAGQNIA